MEKYSVSGMLIDTMRTAYLDYETAGVGNRLFQYVDARLWCEENNHVLLQQGIPEIEIESSVGEQEFKGGVNLYKSQKILQDYNLYRDHITKIKQWECFKEIQDSQINSKDLVIHLRGGNDFLSKNALHIPHANDWKSAIDKVQFEKLHVVTNLKKHTRWTRKDIENLKQGYIENGGDGEPSSTYNDNYPFVSSDVSLTIINSFIDLFEQYDVVWSCGKEIDDFNYMRSFRKIMFPRSTFSWWAAVTGVADEVYVYGSWSPVKTELNLGQTNYDGWNSWGDV